MKGVTKYYLILLFFAVIFWGTISRAQLCPTYASSVVTLIRTDVLVISTDEIDQPPANCTVSKSWGVNIADTEFLLSIDILELRNDQPDLKLRVVLSTMTPYAPDKTFVLEEGAHKRLILRQAIQANVKLTLMSRPGGGEVVDGYAFRARVSVTSEADCDGDDFVCSSLLWIKCFHPSVVCDGHFHCATNISDEINCDYCGQREFDLEINKEVIVGNLDVTSGVCVWHLQAPPTSWILLQFTNYYISDTSGFWVSLSNIPIDPSFDFPGYEFVVFQDFSVKPSAPREMAVKNESVWVGTAFNVPRYARPDGKQSVFRLRVTALNETAMCRPGEFLCDTGIQCVSNNTRCDGLPDCNDFSDELGCSDNCSSDDLVCSHNSQERCLSPHNICDSTKECDDLRDEIGCAPSCGSLVVNLQQNKTHQLGSPSAPASYLRNLKCVWFIKAPPGTAVLISTVNINLYSPATLTVGEGSPVNPTRIIWKRQGGTAPLTDSSVGNDVWVTLVDEYTHDFPSPGDAHFILELSVLDQSVNCSGEHEVACESGYQCINESNVCDGIFHCWDKSDELSCGQCNSELLCTGHNEQICLQKTFICDGVSHCADFADETLCSSSFCGSERYISLEDYPDYTYNISSLGTGFPPMTACLWIFTASQEYRISIEVKHQNTTNDDTTMVGSGSDPTDMESQLGYFEGFDERNLVFASVGNTMWVSFLASNLYQSGGEFWYKVSAYIDTVQCEEGMFKCESSKLCIDDNLQCDGATHCDDLSDEIGCDICSSQSTINITDDQVHTLRANIEEDAVQFPNGKTCVWHILASEGYRILLTVVAIDFKVPSKVDFVFVDGNRWKRTDLFYKNSNLTSKITVTSKTNNVLILFSPKVSSSARFTVKLEQFEPMECDQAGDIVCPSGLACIPEREVCDGTPQCPLLGDEIGCGHCSGDKYWCDGSCLNTLTDICDAIRSCTDFSDEYNCLPCGKVRIVLQDGPTSTSPLLSPNYPENYPSSLQCFWLITANHSSGITFDFSVFNMELHFDSLKIGTGQDVFDESSVITNLTGTLNGVRVLTKTSQAWAHFKSDYSTSRNGFSGMISQSDPANGCYINEFFCRGAAGIICLGLKLKCKGYAICDDESDEQDCGKCGSSDIHLFNGVTDLTSPFYPANYAPATNCTWQIIPASAKPFVIVIIDFVLEEVFDNVTFSVGDSSNGPGLIDMLELTGSNVPIRRLLFHSPIWVTFISDASKNFKGFYFRIVSVSGNLTGCDEGDFDCGNGICIDSAAECNGFNDCINDRDEVNCDDVVCPDAYKCDTLSASLSSTTITGASIPSTLGPIFYSSSPSSSPSSSLSSTPVRCISAAKVCDGTPDCPGMDDETECDVKKCPASCECNYVNGDFNVTCTYGWNSTLLSGVAKTTSLLYLSGETNLWLEPGTFKTLTNLKVLSLKNSQIFGIQALAFDSLDFLLWLDLSSTSLLELHESTFLGMPSLQGITMFDVPLERIGDFSFHKLTQMETLILVRQGKDLPRLEFDKYAFWGLEGLHKLYVDDHRICCFIESVDCETLEPEPPLFMCSNLMPNIVLKVFMWIFGLSALVGNIFVMIWRCREKTEGRASRQVHSLLVFHLAASDSLMGLYMLIIAVADVHFGEKYFEISSEWQTSILCRLAGFISIIASEASVFFLTLISIDRFLSIVFPFSSHHIRPKTGRIISALMWIGTVIVGLVPTILAFDSDSDLYGLSDVCIGLPLMTKVARYETRQQTIDAGGVANITVEIPYAAENRASWFFSIALFLGVNLLCFCVILICYICIFVSVKMSMKRVRRHKSRDDEVRMAVKMAAIVMTDFICWTPVIIMGILSQSRVVEIPPSAYAWIVVFILPINSSLNPYLYTISDLCCQLRRSGSRRKKDTSKISCNENRKSNSVNTVFTIDTSSKQE